LVFEREGDNGKLEPYPLSIKLLDDIERYVIVIQKFFVFLQHEKNKGLLITLGALTPLIVEAQIEDEIKAYVDTTEQIVVNGRKLMIKSVQENDFEKIADIYDYLVRTKSTNNCDIFSYAEDVFTYLLIGD
jgi:hypothetical protein